MITRNTNINEIIEKYPKATDRLIEMGLGCVGCSAAFIETIEQGLIVHGFSKKEAGKIIKELNKTIEK